MSIGSLYLNFQQKFGHGLRVAYYRDVVRPRILDTLPIENTTDKSCEIHVLTSSEDWLNLIWTLKSFYAVTRQKYALCIHGDKTLQAEAIGMLREHFPSARIVPRSEADAKVATLLEPFPRCLKFRRTNLLAPKVFDFIAYLQASRMALFDSDLLFFAEPTAYVRCVEDTSLGRNVFNPDFASAYTVESGVVRERFNFELQPNINTGLGLIQPGSMRWDWIEEFLSLPSILDGHFWRIEQTLFALCSSRYGVELLPAEYTLRLQPGLDGLPFRHYVGRIRHLMYGEGMRELARRGFLHSAGGGAKQK